HYALKRCKYLFDLHLKYGCIPFDKMPLCTSLPGHNPKYSDLIESINTAGRDHELLARRVTNNVLRRGILYTPQSDLVDFKNISDLINIYNKKLYYTHTHRQQVLDKGHVSIRG